MTMTDHKLTSEQRLELTLHPDPYVQTFLRAVESGRIGALYSQGRGASLEPRTDGTLRSYRTTLTLLHSYLDGTPWPDATEEELQDFLYRPTAWGGEQVAGNTARTNRAALRGFYAWLVQEEELIRPKDNPTRFLRAPDANPQQRDPVADALWMQTFESPHLDTDNRVALGLGYFCGLRRFEIAWLRPEQIDPLHKRITWVRRKGGKTKSGLEYGELVDVLIDGRPDVAAGALDWIDLVEFYARYRQGEDDLVPSNGVRNRGQRLADQLEHHVLPAVGLAKDAYTYHQLRHSFGTNMALCQMPDRMIADQMSHSTTETTAGYILAAGQIAMWRKDKEQGSAAARAWAKSRIHVA